MKKLRLDLDALRVDSFGTGAGGAGGTVDAHEMIGTDPILDPGGDTSKIDSCYYNTCYDTCDWSTQSQA